MQRFDDDVQRFLASSKTVTRAWRWRCQRADFTKAGAPLLVSTENSPTGWLQLAAHTYREPKKYSFSVIFRRTRVLGLDVEPGLSHFNASTLESVRNTHWQEWPTWKPLRTLRIFFILNGLTLF